MGAWTHILTQLQPELDVRLECISRPASGAPATGSSKRSANQQVAIIEQAFGAGRSGTKAPTTKKARA